jgi:hypothetical protein
MRSTYHGLHFLPDERGAPGPVTVRQMTDEERERFKDIKPRKLPSGLLNRTAWLKRREVRECSQTQRE